VRGIVDVRRERQISAVTNGTNFEDRRVQPRRKLAENWYNDSTEASAPNDTPVEND